LYRIAQARQRGSGRPRYRSCADSPSRGPSSVKGSGEAGRYVR
jgi:hypothetical protein